MNYLSVRMEDAEQKKKKDEVVYKCGSFCVLNVPEEPPLQYEYEWVLSRLFRDNKPGAMFPFSPALVVHAYQWYQELKAQMDGLKAYIHKHKGQQFASWTDQFLYGSLLESMRDLLAKLFKALFGPNMCVGPIKQMDERLAPYLEGIDGSGVRKQK